MLKQINRRGIHNSLGNRQIKTGLQSWLTAWSFLFWDIAELWHEKENMGIITDYLFLMFIA